MKTNFHTHNFRCGHAIGNVEDYVKEAVKHGYTELGISDHAPVPKYYNDRMKMEELEGYLLEIEEAQKKYEGKIKIYKSLEIEYFPEFQNYYEELKKKLDYLVLGLHAFKMTGETNIFNAWKINCKEYVLAYGKYMVEAIKSGYFDYIAHPDLYMSAYRKWNEHTEKIAHDICKAAEETQLPMEVNANGIRKTLSRHPEWTRYAYPYREFWEVASKYDVRVIIGSDSHDYRTMEDEAMELARKFAKELNLNVIESFL